jgi:hypothetical protein
MIASPIVVEEYVVAGQSKLTEEGHDRLARQMRETLGDSQRVQQVIQLSDQVMESLLRTGCRSRAQDDAVNVLGGTL